MSERSYYLRTCGAAGESYGGFVWPLEVGAEVVAPDWNDLPECGGGLHGLKNGEGDASLLDWRSEAKWLVFSSCDAAVDLAGKQKVSSARVEYVGDRTGAAAFLISMGADQARCIGSTNTGGDDSILCIKWWDSASNRHRMAVGYTGENGIEAGVAYRVDDRGNFYAFSNIAMSGD